MSAPDQDPGGGGPADRSRRLWALFDQAADLPPAEQQALLEAACADDPGLRARVERLLARDARLGAAEGSAFLQSPLLRPTVPVRGPALPARGKPRLPDHIGRYRVLRLLGEGGMGAVYEAEQDSPRRTVALKVVRPGLASAALLQRFRHESQILGRLHHPGTTASRSSPWSSSAASPWTSTPGAGR
jgi:serine/threonine protein kinase